jgi:hypothetical protein
MLRFLIDESTGRSVADQLQRAQHQQQLAGSFTVATEQTIRIRSRM